MIEVEGVVSEALPNAMFGITLQNDHRILATLGGKLRVHYIKVLPGDRVYVYSDPWYRGDRYLATFLSPFERILGITLLGSQTVNSVRNGNTGGNNNGVR
jgi:translation initiation factor IF-1